MCLSFKLCAKSVDIYFRNMLLQARDDDYRSSLHHSGEMKKKIRRLELEVSGLRVRYSVVHLFHVLSVMHS